MTLTRIRPLTLIEHFAAESKTKWPALAKMVKQYFAAPASSAGVERVFSAARKMHGDLQKFGQGLDAGALALRGVQH